MIKSKEALLQEANWEIERKIALAFIDDAIKAGYSITVNDGESKPIQKSTDRKAILDAMFSVGEEHLILYRDDVKAGWVQFVCGSSGWDVISDYSTNLEPLMTNANKISEKYA